MWKVRRKNKKKINRIDQGISCNYQTKNNSNRNIKKYYFPFYINHFHLCMDLQKGKITWKAGWYSSEFSSGNLPRNPKEPEDIKHRFPTEILNKWRG